MPSPPACKGGGVGASTDNSQTISTRTYYPVGAAVPRRLTNLLLLGAVVGLAGSGLYGWITPDRSAGIWYTPHPLLGALLVLTLFWRAPLVRGPLNRRPVRP